MRQSGFWFHLRLSAYWFAASFKWFIILNGMLASRVQGIVGDPQSAERMLGMIVSIGAAEAMIGPIVFGLWSDRVRSKFGRRKPFLLIGAILTAIALFMVYGATSVPQMIAAYVLLQIADDVATAPYSALIPDLVAENERGRASGVMAFLQQFAQVSAAAIALTLGKDVFGIFCAIAIVNFVAVGINFLGVKENPVSEPVEKFSWSIFSGMLRPFKSRDFVWVWFTRFMNAMGFSVVLFFLHYFLQRTLNLSEDDAGSLQIRLGLTISVTSAIGAMAGGPIVDRIGRKKIIEYAGYGMFVAMLVFTYFSGVGLLYGVVALFGVGYGAYLSADWALASDVMPNKEDYARDMGLWSMSIPLAQVVAGGIGSVASLIPWPSAVIQYQVLFTLAAFFFLLSTVLVRLVKASS